MVINAFAFCRHLGNDVCDPSHSYDVMTQPHVFKQNIINILTHFNETLPDGSNIWAFGLVDGSLLYSYLHDRTHPFGVTYSRFYDWLNCNNINPCWGWLNVRDNLRPLFALAF
jgi:acyloxyacyl hydrolase